METSDKEEANYVRKLKVYLSARREFAKIWDGQQYQHYVRIDLLQSVLDDAKSMENAIGILNPEICEPYFGVFPEFKKFDLNNDLCNGVHDPVLITQSTSSTNGYYSETSYLQCKRCGLLMPNDAAKPVTKAAQ